MKAAWKLAWRNLQRQRRRTLVTGAILTLSTVGLVLIAGYITRVQNYLRVTQVYTQRTGHVAIYAQDGLARSAGDLQRYGLGESTQQILGQVLAADPAVDTYGMLLSGSALASGGDGQEARPVTVLGLPPALDLYLRNHPEVAKTVPETVDLSSGHGLEVSAQTPQALLTVGLARALFRAAAPPSDSEVQLIAGTQGGGLGILEAQVVGTFHTGTQALEDRLLVLPLSTAQELVDTAQVTRFAVFLKPGNDAHAWRATLLQRLQTQGVTVEALLWDGDELGEDYQGFCNLLGVLRAFLYSILLSIVVLAIMNNTLIMLRERQSELGLLRALGFLPGTLARLLVREAICLAALAAGSGLVLVRVLTWAIAALNLRFSPPGVSGTIQFLVTPTWLSGFALLATVLGCAVGACAVTGWRRCHQPIDTLLTQM